MGDQQFCLRWNNHQSTLVTVFDTLLENNILVDCTLAAEGQYLKAHKVVLCACSPYLELLLRQHSEKHPILILKDVKFQELRNMMDYMYKGEVNISQEQLETFLKAAESLQIKGLTDNSGSSSGNNSMTNGGDDYNNRFGHQQKRTEQSRKSQMSASAPAIPFSLHSTGEFSRRSVSQMSDTTTLGSPERSRESSASPTPKKRKRQRRPSQTDSEQQFDTCDTPIQSQSISANVPSVSNQILPSAVLNKMNATTVDEQQMGLIVTTDIARASSSVSTDSMLKAELVETSVVEQLLEPKTEYLDDSNENNGADDMMHDDEDEDGMDMGAGPSHSAENSNQGYCWPVSGERGNDEMFGAQDNGTHQQENQEFQGLLFQKMEEIASEMKNVKRQLLTKKKKEKGDTSIAECLNYPFPIREDKDLEMIEELIRSDENAKQKMIKYLSRIGGKTYLDMTYKIMCKVISPRMSIKYSLYGKRGKRPFRYLQLCDVVISAIMSQTSASITDIQRRIGTFLATSGDRDGGRRQRGSTSGGKSLLDEALRSLRQNQQDK